MASSKAICFEGQDFVIGIDVQKKSWAVAVRNNNLRLKNFSMNPSPTELNTYMKANYPGGEYHAVYEAGFCGFWIQRELADLGFDCIVVNVPDIPASNKERNMKTDPVDAQKLARELENGSLKGIYVPDEPSQHFRSLCRLYSSVVQSSTRAKNRIKALLHYNGITLPKHTSHWGRRLIKHLQNLTLDDGPGSDCLMLLVEELLQHRQRKIVVLQKLRQHVRASDAPGVFKNILSVPGIGFKTGVALYAEVIDMRRFKTLDHLKSYVGLVPSVRASGDTEHVLGLTFRRNRFLKYVIIEAAWIAIRKDPALLACYNKLISRMKAQSAIIRIARKLLGRIRYVWLNNVPYKTCVA